MLLACGGNDELASALAAEGHRDVHGDRALVALHLGDARSLDAVHHQAASFRLLPLPSSPARLASPSVRSLMLAPSRPTSTRSTSNWTMRACSAGNSSSQSGSSLSRASRT